MTPKFTNNEIAKLKLERLKLKYEHWQKCNYETADLAQPMLKAIDAALEPEADISTNEKPRST